MFTGIVEEVGKIKKILPIDADIQLSIQASDKFIDGIQLGESIAVSGVCLTVIEVSETMFCADVSVETLNTTTIKFWKVDNEVNLEKSLTFSSRIGGHLVSGHIDGVAEIIKREQEGRSWRFSIRVPSELSRYISPKGSICIDGTSLTVNSIVNSSFEVNIIPETMIQTSFQKYRVGSKVNLEVDLIARYLERLVSADQSGEV